MFVTCCFHISTHYSEKQTLAVFLLCALCGWNSLLMKLLSAMMKLSWLEAVFWFKGSMLRCYNNLLFCLFYFNNFSIIFSPLILFNWNANFLFPTSKLNMLLSTCLGMNLGMTWELELHLREVEPTSWRFQRRVFLLFKGLGLSYQGKTGFVEAPRRWWMILTLWYVIYI